MQEISGKLYYTTNQQATNSSRWVIKKGYIERSITVMNVQEVLQQKLGKEISQSSNQEIYGALLGIVQELVGKKEAPAKKKKIYYISAEFLIGKLLSNNMINLGIYEEVRAVLAQNGKDILDIEEIEQEPSLGN